MRIEPRRLVSSIPEPSIVRYVINDRIFEDVIPMLDKMSVDPNDLLMIVSGHVVSTIKVIDCIIHDIKCDEAIAENTKLYELTEDEYEMYSESFSYYDLLDDIYKYVFDELGHMDFDLSDDTYVIETFAHDLAMDIRDFMIDLRLLHGYVFEDAKVDVVLDLDYGNYCAYISF